MYFLFHPMSFREVVRVDDRDVVWNPIFESLLRLYQKLKNLGFTYFEGKVSIIDIEEKNSHD